MHTKPWLKAGLQRLDGADVALVREAESLYREAIRGELNLGEYGRTALEGAAGGALGGAVAGGVGAVPGALIGAAGNAGIKGVTDLWYATRSNEDKAAWQAGDLEEKLGKLVGIIQSKNPSLASILTTLGNQYKEFIDGHLQGRKSNTFQQNRFNLSPEEQQQKFGEEYNQLYRLQQPKTASSKFLRTAAGAPNYFSTDASGTLVSPNASYGHDLNTAVGQFGKDMLTGTLGGNIGEFGAKKATEKIAPQLLKGVGNLKTMGVGLAGEMTAGAVMDWLENLQGEKRLFDMHAKDVEKIITEINGLSKNDPQVVAAGNQIWSYVLQANEMMNQALASAPPAPPAPQAPATPVAPAAPAAPPISVQASAASRFRRG